MKHINLLIAALLMLAIGCGQETLTGIEADADASSTAIESTAKREVKMVPLKGYVTGYGCFNLARTNCPTGSLPIDFVGTGEATHLGEFEVFYEYCSYAQVDPTNPTSIAWGVFTTDNGDEVHVTEYATATGPTTAVADAVITGGTGRFATATGTYSFVATFGPHPAGDVGIEYEFNGEISSVGSSK
jgi:hypothetical protein